MGRASKDKQQMRHNPLAVQLKEDELGGGILSAPGKRSRKDKHRQQEDRGLDVKESKRILDLARAQQDEELALEAAEEDEDDEDGERPAKAEGSSSRVRQAFAEMEDDEDLEGSDEDEEEYSELEFDGEEGADLDSYLPVGELAPGENLADLILRKINDQEKAAGVVAKAPSKPEKDEAALPQMNPKVVEVYTKIGELLSRYKSGPLPKAFKILPTLSMWPTLVMFTSPETWTPHATLAATRLFASNLQPKGCQKFYKEILLHKVREEIAETKKLSVHTYAALKKAIYKPAAFFKGLLFPLCESGDCTLREAMILGSVLTKISVPVLHSGAALLKLAEMEYTGPNSIFIRVLLDKKYALPYKVLGALVDHFVSFQRQRPPLPVLWHQALLVFVQRYKHDFTPEQRDELIDTVKVHWHEGIGPEIRRELASEKQERARDIEMDVEIL